MSSDVESITSPTPNGIAHERPSIEAPSTPPDVDAIPPSSQITIASTEVPASPAMDPSDSFKTEAYDERIPSSASVIPSSLTPPPSSQVPVNGGHLSHHPLPFPSSQASAILSPPVTGYTSIVRRDAGRVDYAPPSPKQVVEASPDELRAMVQASIVEHAKLKMEAAHHKLQYKLLSLQADEDAKRAEVEHDMTRREVEALRVAEHSRQARRDLNATSDSLQAKYRQLKVAFEERAEEYEMLLKKLRSAKKVIHRQEETITKVRDENEMLLTRLRENREHFNMLRSPGGLLHGVMTPKTQAAATPVQHRATPRQTPKSAQREARHDRGPGQERFAALIQVLSQENNSANSAPSTPTSSHHHRSAPRNPAKHTRNVQSMSSLPTTPTTRPRGEYPGLLPSIDLMPRTEPPPQRFGRGYEPETPVRGGRGRGRKSRESTISAEDNEELAQQQLRSVAALAQASMLSRATRSSLGSHPAGDGEEDEVFESQASQQASEMLRQDPRESFEVVSSVEGSRAGTPAVAEKSPTLQARLFAGLDKSGAAASEKRKFSGGGRDEERRLEMLASPTKRLKVAAGLPENHRVGLGIHNPA